MHKATRYSFLLVLLLLQLNAAFAQQKDEIIEVRTDERIFSGSINSKYDITIYLKYYRSSGDHRGVYSVKGWYYYDNVKKKIPLVGLYYGDLTLFVFQQKEKQDSILEFNYGGGSLWDGLELLKGMSGFDEKMVVEGETHEWITSTKKLPLKIYSEDLSVERETEYIKTKDKEGTRYIDIAEMKGYIDNCELVNSIHTATENSFLLQYEFGSNPNLQGRCGAGTEKGYALIKYDGNYNLLQFENVLLESCYEGLSPEEVKSSDPNLTIYKVTGYNVSSKTITINTAKHTIVVKQ